MGSGGNYLAFASPAPRCSAEKPLQVRDKAKSKRKVRVPHGKSRACPEGTSEGAENCVSKTSWKSLSPSFKPGS